MNFRVLLHPKAKEFLGKLDPQLQERIKNKLKELERFPEEREKHLRYSKFWSLRIGDYRAIYEIQEKRVVVMFIGHRKNVYDDFSKIF
ncbi:MAG: type II toxin-antitoxin system RelE/ParE family toxin [Candidatus Aenigmatarchaeota archaeon]|nr:MAG: type II toxin-antitoxin system RelE/ParE family toxin [Candidatus Aenigmarchaeota archaeon]